MTLFLYVVLGKTMRYFPVFIDAQNLRCLIVGAGEVAARKLELMLKSPAHVTVVAPDLKPFPKLLIKIVFDLPPLLPQLRNGIREMEHSVIAPHTAASMKWLLSLFASEWHSLRLGLLN